MWYLESYPEFPFLRGGAAGRSGSSEFALRVRYRRNREGPGLRFLLALFVMRRAQHGSRCTPRVGCAGQRILCGVVAALAGGVGRRRRAQEEEGEQGDRVGDIDTPIVIAVRALLAGERRRSPKEQESQHINRIADIGKLVKEYIPASEYEIIEELADERDYRVSFAKFAAVFDFSPQRTVGDGILQIKEALDKGRFTDFEADIYYNHKFLRRR